MARYDVDVRLQPGHHVRRRVRARSCHAAYERVAREHIESGGEWSLDPTLGWAIVTRKGLRRKSTVLTGARPDRGDEGGTAGVREPRRPKPTPPSLRAEVE